ncbi:MAG: DUF5060 domain-containing protein [Acidobacteriota bacterium]
MTLVLLCLAAVPSSAEVSSFTLLDASTNAPIAAHDPLQDGAALDMDTLPASLAIRANVTAAVGSVSFDLSGVENHTQTESVAPYALFGDSGGDYNAWMPTAGSYQLAARSHSGTGGGGAAGTELTIGFSVSGGGGSGGGETPEDGDGSHRVLGTLRQWHKVTVELDGPGATETSEPNAFTDFRYQVEFSGPSGQTLSVPGYFAGDGAGQGSGHRWHAHLSPDEPGSWTYRISLRSGNDIAVDLTETTGSALSPFDGGQGQFTVAASNKAAPDFRAAARGLLKNRGHHYLTTSQGEPWVKAGPDVPENFLGYVGFDNTAIGNNRHTFAAHVSDWRLGDPDWSAAGAANAGRAIIGALNYIADRGANSIYFLPMNIGGDGKDTFPTIGPQVKDRFDLSKLQQWEQALAHANELGILLHFVLAETESANENYHDDGDLGPERKLFYRTLHARFGYLNASQWNLGEENDYSHAQREDFAEYLKAVDPYDHPVTNHTKSNQYGTYTAFLGNDDIDMTSFQGGTSNVSLFELIQDWREQSAAASRPWVVSFDEPQKIENDPNDQNAGYPFGRRAKMWPTLMGGGGGFEWYVQQDGGGHGFDQAIDDFGLMDTALRWSGYALEFFAQLPLLAMAPDRGLVTSGDGSNVYALAQRGEVYAVYSADGASSLQLDLSDQSPSVSFSVLWFDPRNGGDLAAADVAVVSGGGLRSLGQPPSQPSADWAVVVRRGALPGPIFDDDFESGDTSAWQ